MCATRTKRFTGIFGQKFTVCYSRSAWKPKVLSMWYLMSSFWKNYHRCFVELKCFCGLQFQHSDAKNEFVRIICKGFNICNHISLLAFLGFFWIVVSAHQPICSRGSSVLCGLMVEVLSKSSKNSKGNIMVCNYFLIGTVEDWYIWMLSFSLFLWNLLNKNAGFPQILC